ncbi:MAG: peptide deformylase [Gammaproteobacteria bacterium]
MSVLTILEFPDERLRKKAEAVSTVDNTVRKLLDDMLQTMYESKGVGLAATQINVHKRVIVIDVSESKDQPVCLINPEIIEQSGSTEGEEGCLSVPGFFENVKRAAAVNITALNREGQRFELEAEGLLAVCIQHEIDHLDGKLFVDYLSPLKKQRIKKKLEKIHKLERNTHRPAQHAL